MGILWFRARIYYQKLTRTDRANIATWDITKTMKYSEAPYEPLSHKNLRTKINFAFFLKIEGKVPQP